jgi:hypothetical protein
VGTPLLARLRLDTLAALRIDGGVDQARRLQFRLAEDLAQSRAKRLNIVASQRSKLPQDQPLLDCGQDRFDQRRFREPRALPVADQHFAKGSGGPKNLTRNSHHDHVRPSLMIRIRADNDGWSFLRSGLIGKRKWD